MELRRIQETGGGTFLVSLPKVWAKRGGLSRGSIVAVIERDDGCLIIDPQYNLEKSIEATTVTPSPYLEREITGKYLLGYDIIQVEGKERINPVDRERVKKVTRRLVGLEIIEETAHKIVLQCLLEPSAFPPDKILRREYLISSGMHKDAESAFFERDLHLAKNIVERDEEVNRLYFLLVRVLRTAILNPSLCEKLGFSLIDCLDYRLVASFIEAIGDSASAFAQNTIKFSNVSLPDVFRQMTQCLSKACYEMHENAMHSFFSRSLSLAEVVLKKHSIVTSLTAELDKEVVNKPLDVISYISAIVAALNRISDYSVDIADLVMPR